MKYAVVSDIHAHAWTVFASVDSVGQNTRLGLILGELYRAADTLVKMGGDTLFVSGDIFHTRGVIDPEVLNPTRRMIDEILSMGVSIYIIPGNHDLKSKDTNALSSAVQNLDQVSLEGTQVRVVNDAKILTIGGRKFGFVPWRWTQEALLEDLKTLAADPDHSEIDVFIHAGVDGVIPGMPEGGLSDTKLAAFGFRHIFAGHYHNHKVMAGGVISVGATTHQTWGDVGSRAGFLTVDGDTGAVTFNDTMAPKFIDISGMDEDEMELESKGNYVRFRGPPMSQDDVNELRTQLKAWGALGVSIEVPRATVSARPSTPVKGLTTEQSIENFVLSKPAHPSIAKEAIVKRAIEVLDASRAVIEEA